MCETCFFILQLTSQLQIEVMYSGVSKRESKTFGAITKESIETNKWVYALISTNVQNSEDTTIKVHINRSYKVEKTVLEAVF
jgi:hypothetical protein